MISFFSTHSGAGGACQGAKQAGLTLLGGIEIDQYCVDLHRANFGDGIRHESILDTPVKELPDFDFLWSSPQCQSFSQAKTDGEETTEDIAQALKVCDLIRIKKPRYFALENVRGYVESQSFYSILSTLKELGYNTHHAVYDTADFGVPQNRHRLILRASRDPLGDLAQTHSKQGGLWWHPWEGWYSAVADLLPTCKQSQLTKRQLQALSKKGWDLKSVLVEGKDHTTSNNVVRANYEPSYAILADGKGHAPRAVLNHADVRALDYRCLSRLQTFPGSYKWGKSAGKNCRAIGNAVPSLFAQKVIESILDLRPMSRGIF